MLYFKILTANRYWGKFRHTQPLMWVWPILLLFSSNPSEGRICEVLLYISLAIDWEGHQGADLTCSWRTTAGPDRRGILCPWGGALLGSVCHVETDHLHPNSTPTLRPHQCEESISHQNLQLLSCWNQGLTWRTHWVVSPTEHTYWRKQFCPLQAQYLHK